MQRGDQYQSRARVRDHVDVLAMADHPGRIDRKLHPRDRHKRFPCVARGDGDRRAGEHAEASDSYAEHRGFPDQEHGDWREGRGESVPGAAQRGGERKRGEGERPQRAGPLAFALADKRPGEPCRRAREGVIGEKGRRLGDHLNADSARTIISPRARVRFPRPEGVR